MITFDDGFRTRLIELFTWRRDVRRFRPDPLPPQTLERLIHIACLSPSVGEDAGRPPRDRWFESRSLQRRGLCEPEGVPSCFAASRRVAVIGQGTRLAIACSAFSAIAVVESGDSIHDIIKFVRSSVPIYMIGTGWVASAGALIYLAGEKRFRFCLPNTRFLLHQPMGGVQGPATGIDIAAREIIKMRERLSKIIATETGQSIERVRTDTDRNYWMSASEAIDYGLAYKIVRSVEDLK